MESLIIAYDKNMHWIYPDLNSGLSKKFHFLWNGPCGFGSDVLFKIDFLRRISFFCQNAHHDWLTKEYISNWFLVNWFSDRVFYVTIAIKNADIRSLKSLHILFGKYLDHMLVKFEQNYMVRTKQNSEIFNKNG